MIQYPLITSLSQLLTALKIPALLLKNLSSWNVLLNILLNMSNHLLSIRTSEIANFALLQHSYSKFQLPQA